ncbi:hypothetical protein BV20DRAFT_260929 [Pilatotrama ljubarskyi]|nr:hypothetical protein BV20DRAFT_260929 [Pilatotrama ljubarskyi]
MRARIVPPAGLSSPQCPSVHVFVPRWRELEREARRLAPSSHTMASPANTTASAGAAAAAPSLPALDNTFGAMFLGTVFGQMLYGLTVYQTYKYFRLFTKDTPFHKVLVVTVLLLETFHAVLCIHVCYYYVITNYANPVALTKDIWSLRLLTVVTGAAIILSQSFYARRVWLIGRGFRFVVIIAIVLMLGEAAFTMAATVESFILPTLYDFRQFSWMVSATRTGFKTTDNIIEVLILYMVNTGLLTGIISVIAFVFYMRTRSWLCSTLESPSTTSSWKALRCQQAVYTLSAALEEAALNSGRFQHDG